MPPAVMAKVAVSGQTWPACACSRPTQPLCSGAIVNVTTFINILKTAFLAPSRLGSRLAGGHLRA